MNRRLFFRNLLGAAAAPLVPSVVKDITPVSAVADFHWHEPHQVTHQKKAETPWMRFEEWKAQQEIMEAGMRRMGL